MNDDQASSASTIGVNGVVEDGGDVFFEELGNNSTPPVPEPWRNTAQSWGDIFRFLYDGDIKSAAATCLVINKDISFLVGQEVVYAHSFVLQMKSGYFSRVIAKLFDQALMGKGRYQDDEGHQMWELKPLPIPHDLADPETFNAIIKFMYLEEIDEGVSDEKLVQFIDASKRFEVRLMEKKCKIMMGNRLNSKNVVAVYQVAERFKNERLMGKCLEIILKLGPEFFTGPDFLNVSHSLLCKLLESNDINVPEMQIFNSAISWATLQLQKSKLLENGENLRKILHPAHRYIRFPLMPPEFIGKDVRSLGLLNELEFNELAVFNMSRNNGDLKIFCSHPRIFQEKVFEVPSTASSQSTQQQSQAVQNHIPQMSSHISEQAEGNTSAAPIDPLPSSKTKTPFESHSDPVPQTDNSKAPVRCHSTDGNNPSESTARIPLAEVSIAGNSDSPKPTQPANPYVDILSSSSEQEDGEVATTPYASPCGIPRNIRRLSSDHGTQQNGNIENLQYQGCAGGSNIDRKRKLSLSTDTEENELAAKRSNPSSQDGCDKVLTLRGSLDTVLTIEDVLSRLDKALLQHVGGIEEVAKIILWNVLLHKRRNAKPSIIVPNIRHIEIVFDTATESKNLSIHPDDYLIFGNEPGVEVLLDKGLWQGKTRMSIWENGIRRFEVNPADHTFFVNVDNPSMASHIVKRMVVDLQGDDLIKKLALSCTPVHFKLSPVKLTHLVLHRCTLERTDVLRDCANLVTLSWIGFIEKDILDLSHLANSSSTLTTLSLCNINIKVDKGLAPVMKALNTMHLVMCRWDLNFEDQLGRLGPRVRRLFITAYHNFIPSNIMAAAFLTQMIGIENVLVTYAAPWVLKCLGRVEEGRRFLRFVEAKVIVTNTSLSTTNIPRNGFRLRRMGRNWNFLPLPITATAPKCPGLVDKEYFDYFLLQVFAKDAASYFRETTLECKHDNCKGRYFHQGNILDLCLHEQSLMDKHNGSIPNCCTCSLPSSRTKYHLSRYEVFTSETPKMEK